MHNYQFGNYADYMLNDLGLEIDRWQQIASEQRGTPGEIEARSEISRLSIWCKAIENRLRELRASNLREIELRRADIDALWEKAKSAINASRSLRGQSSPQTTWQEEINPEQEVMPYGPQAGRDAWIWLGIEPLMSIPAEPGQMYRKSAYKH